MVGTLAHMGGAERQALYFVEHLSTLSGCTVEVLAFEDGAALRPALAALGVRVHVLPYYFRWPRGKRARALARLALLLRTRIKPDALLPFVGIHSKTMAQAWPFSGARFCWWNQQDEGRDLGGTPTERRILKRVSCITSNSTAGQDFLEHTYGLDRDSILVYNNGTPVPDLDSISTHWKARAEFKSRRLVAMLANVTEFKDHATLLKAWIQVKQHFAVEDSDGAQPVLLLAGHLRDSATVAGLKVMSFELGLSSDDVHFLGPVTDVMDLVRSSELVVHSSVTEGCPNAVCEAMSLARAVVATDIPGCRQALGAQGIRWLAEAKNPAAMARLIIDALSDPALMAATGAANRRRIESDFSIEAMNLFFQRQVEAGLGRSLS